MIHKNLVARRKRNKAKKAIYGPSILQKALPLLLARRKMLITPDFNFKKEIEYIERNISKALGVPKEMLQDASTFSR